MPALESLPTDNLFVQHARRSSRHLLVWNLCLLAAVIIAALSQYRYLYNFFRPPAPIAWNDLAAISRPSSLKQYYVKVNGEDSINTGMREMESSSSSSDSPESVRATYHLLKVGPKLLVVRSPSEAKETAFTGALVDIPQPVQEFVSEMQAKRPELRDTFLPYMLDASNFRSKGYLFVAVGFLLLLLSLWNLSQYVGRKSNPDRHPVVHALAKHGEPAQLATSIDAEVGAAGYKRPGKASSVMLTESWLLISRTFGIEIIPLRDLMWMHMKVTQHRVNFVPAGKTFEAIIYTRDGQSHTINATPASLRPSTKMGYEASIEHMLQEFSKSAPWAIVGYSDETERVWKSNRAQFIASVDERRQ